MKFLRSLVTFFLFLVILSGLGYIGYTYYYTQMYPNAYNQSSQNSHTGMGQTPDGNTQVTPDVNQNVLTYSSFALQSKDRLTQLTSSITQAIDMITMDPYSKITVPYNTDTKSTQQGGTSINIYPNATTPVNITPPTDAANTSPGMTANESMMQNTVTTGSGFVYDQGKLEQLHSGIFKLAQGIMLLNQLNDDLTLQSSTIEPAALNYQNYMNRYQLSLRNKAKLSNAIDLITDGSNLINVNPYAAANGYQYNATYMEKLHSGIYKLAQGIIMASELNEDFTNQMAKDIVVAQYMYNSMYNMGNMDMTTNTGWGFNLNSLNLTFVFNLILVILIVSLIIGIFGAIGQLFKGKATKAEYVKE